MQLVLHYNFVYFFMGGGSPLLTPWNRVLLEKLTGFAASEEIAASKEIWGYHITILVLQ
jgi:hypothetical protein